MDQSLQEQYVRRAWNAVGRAEILAQHAEGAAHSVDRQEQAPALAAAGSLWADIARTYTAIAAALPESHPELPTASDEKTEA